jgi:hypothetical protein
LHSRAVQCDVVSYRAWYVCRGATLCSDSYSQVASTIMALHCCTAALWHVVQHVCSQAPSSSDQPPSPSGAAPPRAGRKFKTSQRSADVQSRESVCVVTHWARLQRHKPELHLPRHALKSHTAQVHSHTMSYEDVEFCTAACYASYSWFDVDVGTVGRVTPALQRTAWQSQLTSTCS